MLAAMVSVPWWLPFGSVPEIEAHALAARLEREEPVQLLDVRSPAEFERGRIEGSRSVPITELRPRLHELGLDPAVFTVAICLSAHRSVPAVRLLKRHGYTEVVQLAGGMRAWWANAKRRPRDR